MVCSLLRQKFFYHEFFLMNIANHEFSPNYGSFIVYKRTHFQ